MINWRESRLEVERDVERVLKQFRPKKRRDLRERVGLTRRMERRSEGERWMHIASMRSLGRSGSLAGILDDF